ncbi:hypothetical protein EMCRGX_G029549 [Ephydatia muelleri]
MDTIPSRMSGPYAVTLVSSTPVFTVRVVVTATLALNGSKVTCEESSNGVAYTQIGNGYFYVQAPPRPPNITTRSMGEGWMTAALIQSINGGVPSLFIVTINRTMSISVNAINGTAMVNLTGLSDCKAPYEISVTALNCAGNASDTIWSQLFCIPSTLILTPTPYSSEHGVASQHYAVQVADKLSLTSITIASTTTAVTILFLVVFAIITLTAVYLWYKSRVSLNHQITSTSVYEEVASQQKRQEERIEVHSNEAYQKPTTTGLKVNIAYVQVQH